MKKIKPLFMVLLLTAVSVNAGSISTANGLITEMNKKYSKKWYKTLTFVQKNTSYRPDGTTHNSVWYEAMSLPGRLHIDFGPIESRNGTLFVNGEQHNFRNGKLIRSSPVIHPLMVLGFDVYGQPAATTIEQLKNLKFDLSVFREDKWRGRASYVVGAKAGDAKTLQFWIDKEHLYLVRTIQPSGPEGSATSETQFNKYMKAPGGGWLAPEVLFINNGKPVFKEEYEDMQFGVELSEELFDPAKWSVADKSYFVVKKPGR